MISQSQIYCSTITFCIAAIFVKYCYTTGSWLLNSWGNLRLWNRTVAAALAASRTGVYPRFWGVGDGGWGLTGWSAWLSLSMTSDNILSCHCQVVWIAEPFLRLLQDFFYLTHQYEYKPQTVSAILMAINGTRIWPPDWVQTQTERLREITETCIIFMLGHIETKVTHGNRCELNNRMVYWVMGGRVIICYVLIIKWQRM